MFNSTRFISFMASLILTHLLMFCILFIKPEFLQPVALSGYGFLSAFGLVTGGSKIAEKWKNGNQV